MITLRQKDLAVETQPTGEADNSINPIQLNQPFNQCSSSPNAKINIGLNIINRRDDGYHNLETIFYPINIKDALEIVVADELSFESSGLEIPAGRRTTSV